MSISSTASSALRPRHGAPAACALWPVNVYSTDTMPLLPSVAPGDAEVAADVGEERDVDVLEHAGAHEVRLGGHGFFGDTRPERPACRAASRAP